jgi:hypothetical protein
VSAVLDFLRGTGRDDRGRRLSDIWALDDAQLESSHDFIQWIFPLDAPSAAVPGSPVLAPAEIEAIRRDPALRAGMRRSLDRMLAFYGLSWDAERAAIGLSPFFAQRAGAWISPGNHNFLRISRILRSLVLAGERDAARALLRCLEGLCTGPHGRAIGATSRGFWRRAAEG